MKTINPVVIAPPATRFAVDGTATINWTAPNDGDYMQFTVNFFDDDDILVKQEKTWLTFTEASEYLKDSDAIHAMIAKKLGLTVTGDVE